MPISTSIGLADEISCILVRPDESKFVRLRPAARSLSISESPARRSIVWATTMPRVTPDSRQAQHRSAEPGHALAFAGAALPLRSSSDQPEFDVPGARTRPPSASAAGRAAVGLALRGGSVVARPAGRDERRQAALHRPRADRYRKRRPEPAASGSASAPATGRAEFWRRRHAWLHRDSASRLR